MKRRRGEVEASDVHKDKMIRQMYEEKYIEHFWLNY
jgi:hypothetical protein